MKSSSTTSFLSSLAHFSFNFIQTSLVFRWAQSQLRFKSLSSILIRPETLIIHYRVVNSIFFHVFYLQDWSELLIYFKMTRQKKQKNASCFKINQHVTMFRIDSSMMYIQIESNLAFMQSMLAHTKADRKQTKRNIQASIYAEPRRELKTSNTSSSREAFM